VGGKDDWARAVLFVVVMVAVGQKPHERTLDVLVRKLQRCPAILFGGEESGDGGLAIQGAVQAAGAGESRSLLPWPWIWLTKLLKGGKHKRA
jgi:hypothetical protein